MKQHNPRIKCADGVSLNVQASAFCYCEPRIDEIAEWTGYEKVEVGYIENADPPEEWRQYADGDFPSDVYGWVTVPLVQKFIADHGGEVKNDQTRS